jgi:hypothetical protein
VDVGDALLQRQPLGHAHGVPRGLHLAVDVGLGHVVHVQQHQLRHTAAGQRLDRPRAHATQPDHGHAGLPHTRVAGVAVKPPQAAEAPLQVGRLCSRQGVHMLLSRRHTW